jgi:adenosylcobinamide-GDP ribazoletransferase
MPDMSSIRSFSHERLIELVADLLVCLRFSTRVPIPRLRFEPVETVAIATAAPMLPVAGALIGGFAALLLCLAVKLNLPISVAALLSITALIAVTGALHEDGLADFADCMGGASIEQRLAIMKDSRIGTFGTLALVVFVLARILCLASLASHSLALASAVLISAAAGSRGLALLPLFILAPARDAGLGATSAPKRQALRLAIAASIAISLAPLFAGTSVSRIAVALILSAGTAYGMTMLARRMIGGQTGDVAGATQQVAEVTTYLVFVAGL